MTRARAGRRVGHDAASTQLDVRARARTSTLPVDSAALDDRASERPRRPPRPRRCRTSRRTSRSRSSAACRSAINGVAMPLLELHRQPRHHRRRARRRPDRPGRRLHAVARRARAGAAQSATPRRARRSPRVAEPRYCRRRCTTARGSRRCAQALDAFVDAVQERVTGVVRLKLFKGDCASSATSTCPIARPRRMHDRHELTDDATTDDEPTTDDSANDR